jgi:hypothetical protein
MLLDTATKGDRSPIQNPAQPWLNPQIQVRDNNPPHPDRSPGLSVVNSQSVTNDRSAQPAPAPLEETSLGSLPVEQHPPLLPQSSPLDLPNTHLTTVLPV